MRTTLTKYFSFSASHSRGGKVLGHNYLLGVTVDGADGEAEAALVREVERLVIGPMASRDLGMHVDFLRGAAITDGNLLQIFWQRLEKGLKDAAGAALRSLSLQRDARTAVVLERDHA